MGIPEHLEISRLRPNTVGKRIDRLQPVQHIPHKESGEIQLNLSPGSGVINRKLGIQDVSERGSVFVLVAMLDIQQSGDVVAPGEKGQLLSNAYCCRLREESLETGTQALADGFPEELDVVIAFQDNDGVPRCHEIGERVEEDRMTVDYFINLESAGWLRAPQPVRAVDVVCRDSVGMHLLPRREREHFEEVEEIAVDDEGGWTGSCIMGEEILEVIVPEEILRRRPDAGGRVFSARQMKIGNNKEPARVHTVVSGLSGRRDVTIEVFVSLINSPLRG